VLTHEYAHILHLEQARAFAGGLRKVLGRHALTFPNALSPLWVTEGIATLIESEATDAGRLKGTFVDMVLRTAAVEDRWLTQAQAGGLSPEWPGGSASYYYGSKFLGWAARTQGIDRVTEYFHDYSGNFLPYRVNASAKNAFGRSMTDLWRQWSDEQQAEYRADQTRIAADGITSREAITRLGYETRLPAISPDSTRLAYTYRGPFEWPTIRVYDLVSKRDVASHRVNTTSPISWSSDGASIVYSQLDYRGSFAAESDLYLWRVGGDSERLTVGARLKEPAFSPDGKSIIAVENRAGRNRLVELDLGSRTIRPLISPTDYTQFGEPSVNRDGSRIAVAEWHAGRVDVVVYDRSGTRIANLTETLPRATHASPRFTADGSTILFSSDVTGVPNIYSVAATGGVPRRLTNVYGGAFFPTSADGRRIYFTDYSSRGFDIASFDVTRDYPVVPRVIPKTLVTRAAEVRDVSGDAQEPSTLPDAPYSPVRTVLPRWWMPLLGEIAYSEGGDTRFELGAATAGGDILGFHTYSASVLARTGSDVETQIDYGLIYSYDRWYPTLTLAANGFSDDTDAVIRRGGDSFRYRERTNRALALMTVPYRRARFQLSGTVGAIRDHVSSDMPFDVSGGTLATAGIFAGTLQGIRVGGAFNTARQFEFSISPENGVTALFDAENLSRAFGSDASLRQYRADVRGYRAIPLARSPLGRHVLAARVAGGTTSGHFVLQRDLKVGGLAEGAFAVLDTTQFPVRGYSDATLRGDSAAVASIEYRFPIWQIDRGPGTWPVFFNRLIGDIFFDTGSAWNRRAVELPAISRPRTEAFSDLTTISSAGAELGLDLTLGYFAPLRYRVGVAYPFDEPNGSKGTQFYVSFGSSF
jgi:Tol biopolymer transport system component